METTTGNLQTEKKWEKKYKNITLITDYYLFNRIYGFFLFILLHLCKTLKLAVVCHLVSDDSRRWKIIVHFCMTQ